MKKRRPCTWNQSRSPRNSPRSSHPYNVESIPVRSKSFHDLKRRRLQRNSAKAQSKNEEYGKRADVKKDAFGSLESLFDIKKPLNLSDIQSFQAHNYGKGDSPVSTPKSRSFFQSPQRLVEPSTFPYSLSDGAQLEPHIAQPIDVSHLGCTEDSKELKQLEELEENFLEPQPFESKEEILDNKSDEFTNMADGEETPAGNEEVDVQPTDAARNEAEEQETTDGTESGEMRSEELKEKRKDGKGDEKGEKGQPPPYSMPPGFGEGIHVKPGGHRESTMSAIPLTDTAVMKEMKEADERCTTIVKEMEQLKKELTELTNKKDLTQEDTLKIMEKQESVMAKLGEFEKITRKLQRLLGLADPSSQTFAKMFGMLPYPHGKRNAVLESLAKNDLKLDSSFLSVKVTHRYDLKEVEMPSDGKDEKGKTELYDIPQVEYPEDKLPRVIVCGYTEENIPKIVIGDSERKGKEKCLQNLTGKLNESLNMQEKLVKENAQLEGGRYKLEEALLEKDNAVDSLQRKVCGLQAEMRIVVKENSELSRQLISLNQRIASPNCCYTCPSSPIPPASSLPSSRGPMQDDDSCCCKHYPQDQIAKTYPPPFNTVCVSPDNVKIPSACNSNGSPRLAGGACTGSSLIAAGQEGGMCCRNPAVAKAPAVTPPSRGTCPAEIENKLTTYGNNTKQLEQQLGSMECEVRNMQMELANVQRERQQLEQQRKLLKCTGPCAPCACCPPSVSSLQQQQVVPCGPNSGQSQASAPTMSMSVPMPLAKMNPQQGPPTCSGPCINAPMGSSTCPQQQLRDLREQYARLQDDYKSKLCEVSCLRAESEKMKQETREAKEEKESMENRLIDLEERMKICEAEKNKLTGSKEQLVEQEQALLVAKQRFREAQDELEELRSLIQDQANQLEDYRNKYLQAQQQVEEQRRQLDLMEMDNARMNENVTLEIGRVKNQFQEKLAELAPLPDILKQTQVKLQETQQMRLLAERNCEDLSRELFGYKDKLQTLQSQLDILRNENQAFQDEKAHGSSRSDELEKRNSELRNENERMKNSMARYDEHVGQMQKRIDEKMHEVTQLTAMLEQVREDSARQVARTKERCETVRRSMQGQIAEMEKQLAQCRATARSAQKDRDEIRQKMQGQINNLNEAFEQAQGRIRSLQGHVNYLKNSYSNIFKGQGESPPSALHGESTGQGQGYDSCDCNY